MHTMIDTTETLLQSNASSSDRTLLSEANMVAWESSHSAVSLQEIVEGKDKVAEVNVLETCSTSSYSESESYADEDESLSEIDSSLSFQSTVENKGELTLSESISSLKTRSLSEPRYINTDKRNWLCLPPPAMAVCSAPDLSEAPEKTTKRVSFDCVKIRSYQQTLGDNPSVAYGPPISLDWEFQENEAIDINEYETERVFSRRTLRQLAMSYYLRKAILSRDYGFTEEELQQGKKEANKVKFLRGVTNTLLPMMQVEAAIESAGRKAKRMIRKGKK
jgi:hypothetical protein